MAKYNAIYEGRLPHAMYHKIITDKAIAEHQGISAMLLNIINKAYSKIIDIVT